MFFPLPTLEAEGQALEMLRPFDKFQICSTELPCNVSKTLSNSVVRPKEAREPSEYESKPFPTFSISKQMYYHGFWDTIKGDHNAKNTKQTHMIEENNIFDDVKSELTLISEEIVENILTKILTDQNSKLPFFTKPSHTIQPKLKEEGEELQCTIKNIGTDKGMYSDHFSGLQHSGSQLPSCKNITNNSDNNIKMNNILILTNMSNFTLAGRASEMSSASCCRTAQAENFQKAVKDITNIDNQYQPSLIHTILPATKICLEDTINMLMANVSASDNKSESHSKYHRNISDDEYAKNSNPISHKMKCKISNGAAWNTNNSNVNQPFQGNIDVPQVVESVYLSIMQCYRTSEALQAAVVCSSNTFLDKVANTIIIEMTHHLQPGIPADESAEEIVEEILEDLAKHPPRASCGRSKEFPFSAVYSASFLEDVVSGLLFKIVFTSNIMVTNDQKIPKCELSKAAMRLVPNLVKEINKSQVKVTNIEETCEDLQRHENDVDKVVDSVYLNFFKLYGCYRFVQRDIKCTSNMITKTMVSLMLVEINNYQIESPAAVELSPPMYTTLEPIKVIHKLQSLFKSTHLDQPLSPTTTVLSSKVLEDIVLSLFAKMHASSDSGKQIRENQISLPGSEQSEMNSRFVQDVMIRISGNEIWYTKDATFIQRVPSQLMHPNVDDTINSSVIQTHSTTLKLPDSMSPERQPILKKTPRLLFRQISNPNFMSFHSEESSTCSYSLTSESSVTEPISSELEQSEETARAPYRTFVYSSLFLEEIISGVSSKLFFTVSNRILKEKGATKSEAQLNNMATAFVNCVLMEIENAHVKVTSVSQEKYKFPEIHKHAVDAITKLVSNNIHQEYETDSALFTCLTHSSSLCAEKIVRFILSAISDYQLQCPISEDVAVYAYTSLNANNIVPEVVNSVMEASNQSKNAMAISPRFPSTTSVKASSVVETIFDDITHPGDESSCAPPCMTTLSSAVLEEIVARFLSKLFFNCPNLNLGSKEMSSVSQVKAITDKLLKALFITISEKKMKISEDGSETRFIHPKDCDIIEQVINAVYSEVYQLSESHMSIYQNLAREGDVLAHIVANLMIAEMCNYHFQPICPRGRLSDAYVGIESSYIVQKVLNDIRGTPSHTPLLDNNSHGLHAPFLEEIVSQFLTKMFVSSACVHNTMPKNNTIEEELSKIASRLINSVLKELMKSEINVIKRNNGEQCLHSDDEDFIAVVVDSVYINALHETGSPLKLFKALTTGCTLISERIATLVMKEISKYQLQPFLAAGEACDLYTEIEVTKIVQKVLCEVAAQSNLNSYAECIVHSITDKITDTTKDEDFSIPTIIPYYKQTPVEVDSAIITMHLTVFSIKTKPLEVLETESLLLTGQTLSRLRNLNIAGRSRTDKDWETQPLSPEFHLDRQNQSRASLDKFGRLDFRPKKVNTSLFISITLGL
ncbi:fibrous sheath-interacting protein 2-like [Lissotriton helveticus]